MRTPDLHSAGSVERVRKIHLEYSWSEIKSAENRMERSPYLFYDMEFLCWITLQYRVCLWSFMLCSCTRFRGPGLEATYHCSFLCNGRSLWRGAFLQFFRCPTWRRDGEESYRKWSLACRFMLPRQAMRMRCFIVPNSRPSAVQCYLCYPQCWSSSPYWENNTKS